MALVLVMVLKILILVKLCVKIKRVIHFYHFINKQIRMYITCN